MADVDDADDHKVVLNEDNLSSSPQNESGVDEHENVYFQDLPDALIVTNLEECIFDDVNCKAEFESLFRKYDDSASFLYLKSFRRARVNFSTPEMAATARIHLNEVELYGKRVKCYFAQPKDEEGENKDPHLHPPPLQKQFLISPPASPPVGWEQTHEAEPIINYDLISAVANLAPGMSHEIHPPSDKHPAIVVHICEDPPFPPINLAGQRPKIIQTRRPDVSERGT
ncbi:calcipressin-2-like isoform X1 [Crassostrea virginica]